MPISHIRVQEEDLIPVGIKHNSRPFTVYYIYALLIWSSDPAHNKSDSSELTDGFVGYVGTNPTFTVPYVVPHHILKIQPLTGVL